MHLLIIHEEAPPFYKDIAPIYEEVTTSRTAFALTYERKPLTAEGVSISSLKKGAAQRGRFEVNG